MDNILLKNSLTDILLKRKLNGSINLMEEYEQILLQDISISFVEFKKYFKKIEHDFFKKQYPNIQTVKRNFPVLSETDHKILSEYWKNKKKIMHIEDFNALSKQGLSLTFPEFCKEINKIRFREAANIIEENQNSKAIIIETLIAGFNNLSKIKTEISYIEYLHIVNTYLNQRLAEQSVNHQDFREIPVGNK